MNTHTLGLGFLIAEMAKHLYNYIEFNAKGDRIEQKICFLGLALYPNIPTIPNFDILTLYKAFNNPYMKASIHDPHIGLYVERTYGVKMGRQGDDNWTHAYDALILSTPHHFYLDNLDKLFNLFKPHKQCLFLDLWGAIDPTRLSDWGLVDLISMKAETERYDTLGGEYPPDSMVDAD